MLRCIKRTAVFYNTRMALYGAIKKKSVLYMLCASHWQLVGAEQV